MPMNSEAHQKVAAAHLSRMAYLYVRQSTLRQVFENTESRLLELCALSDTLILDEDGLYDPANFNDRLLLGMNRTAT